MSRKSRAAKKSQAEARSGEPDAKHVRPSFMRESAGDTRLLRDREMDEFLATMYEIGGMAVIG